MKSIFLVLLSLLCVNSALAHTSDWGWGPGQRDPDHDPDYKRRQREYRSPVDACEADKDGQKISLNQMLDVKDIPAAVQKLLDVITISPVARPTVARFREKFASGEIKVQLFTDFERRRMNDVNGDIMATFEFVPKENSKTIYVHFLRENLGTLAVQFFHEMVHSVDADLLAFLTDYDNLATRYTNEYEAVWDAIAARLNKRKQDVQPSELTADELAKLNDIAAKRAKLAKKRNDGTYMAEYKAFYNQMEFLRDAVTRIGCYKTFIDQEKRTNDLNLWIDDIEDVLRNKYGLTPPAVLERR